VFCQGFDGDSVTFCHGTGILGRAECSGSCKGRGAIVVAKYEGLRMRGSAERAAKDVATVAAKCEGLSVRY